MLREVEGDFEIQVKVDGTFKPTGPGTTLLNMPTYEAGLVLINDADNFITLLRSASFRNDKNNTSVVVSHRTEARGQGMRLPQIGRGTTYLRLVRQGSKFIPSASNDGKTWESLRLVEVDWPDRLKLGVTASPGERSSRSRSPSTSSASRERNCTAVPGDQANGSN